MKSDINKVCLWLLFAGAALAAPADEVPRGLAPDFALPSVGGPNERLSEHRGEVVLLSFWSSRCAACDEQLAQLRDLQRTYGPAGLVVLAVSVDDDLARAREYARAHAGEYSLLIDARKLVSRRYQVERLPAVLLIDRAGVLRFRYQDYHGSDNPYVAGVRELLDDEPPAPTRITR